MAATEKSEGRGRSGGDGPSSSQVCFECGSNNHRARDCPKMDAIFPVQDDDDEKLMLHFWWNLRVWDCGATTSFGSENPRVMNVTFISRS